MVSVLRIAMLVDPLTARQGGGEHAAELARALSARGHSVRIFGAPFQPPPDEPLVPSATGEQVVRDRRGHTRGERDNGRTLLDYAPGAVVAYDALSPTAWLGARIARRLRAPLFLVEHGEGDDEAWLMRGVARVGQSLWGAYVRRTACGLIALDHVARDQALREGFDGARIHLMPHGVDLERFRPGQVSPLVAQHRMQGRMLLCVAPLEPRAHIEVLLSAFAATVGQRSDWCLTIAGEGSGYARLRAMADRLGVASRVRVLRTPTHGELPALLSSATIAVQASTFDPSLGVQLARLFASGVAVIAAEHPRLTHLIEPEVNGLLAKPGELASWTEMIQRAAGAPDARTRWGHAVRRMAEERLAWSVIAQQLEQHIAGARAERGVEERAGLQARLESGLDDGLTSDGSSDRRPAIEPRA